MTFRVDASQAFPGGVVVVRLGSRGRLGAAWALLDGRRAAVLLGPRRAPGARAGGRLRRGGPRHARRRDRRPRRRAAHRHPDHDRVAGVPAAVRLPVGGRARAPRAGPRRPTTAGACWPCCAPSRRSRLPAFSCRRSARPGAASASRGRTPALADVESRIDALQGERHRGLDYAVPVGTPVRAPAAGTVLFAGPLALSGETVVIDHGQGVLSVLQHLSRVDARVGDAVARPRRRRPLGRHRPRPRADAAVARLPPRRRRGPDGDRPAAVSGVSLESSRQAFETARAVVLTAVRVRRLRAGPR